MNILKYVCFGNGFEFKFLVFEKLEVNGENVYFIFKFLRECLFFLSDDFILFMISVSKILWVFVSRNDIVWNFEKFFIIFDGKLYWCYSRYYIMMNI